MNLFNYITTQPAIMRNVRKSFATLSKHAASGKLDVQSALRLLANNVRDGARHYERRHGNRPNWHDQQQAARMLLQAWEQGA